MPPKFSVKWAEPTFRPSGCGSQGIWYLDARVKQGSQWKKVCSSVYSQGHYTCEAVESEEAQGAFLQKLTPTPRARRVAVPPPVRR